MMTDVEVLLSQCVNNIQEIEERQAVDDDYKTPEFKDKYDRGHLNPKGHHERKDVLRGAKCHSWRGIS